MKKYFTIKIFAGFIFILLFNACVKDSCQNTYNYSFYIPVYKTSAEVRANIKSNPATEIKNPGKIFILGNYIFLNEINKGIHLIDNTNPSAPVNAGFIDIPGNLDIAIKGNILYADLYTDLVALDISNPLNVIKTKIIDGVFPHRYYGSGFMPDSSKIITDWIKRDTTVVQECSSTGWTNTNRGILFAMNAADATKSAGSATIGIAGSMARFALMNNYLYTVSNTDLNAFNISNTSNPAFANKTAVGLNIETIYPFKNNLFIGSANGMFIYNMQSSPANPVKVGEFAHARACDPVIADDNYAYVTLRTGTACRGTNNQMDIIRLNNLTNSALAKTYQFTNPHGLSKDGILLFICDGTQGLKLYDASDVMNLKLIKQISGMETYDVIAYNNIAYVVAKDGLYQYNYSDLNNIRFLSKMGITK